MDTVNIKMDVKMVSSEYEVISSECSSGFSYINDISCLLTEYSKVKIVQLSSVMKPEVFTAHVLPLLREKMNIKLF